MAVLDQELAQAEGCPRVQLWSTASQFANRRTRRAASVAQNAVRNLSEEQIYGAIKQDTTHDSPIQLRGELSRPGVVVSRRNLEILGGESLPAEAGSGRYELAEWITRDENPLFAHVMVNRIWQQHFGRGLVGTENDFGLRGERPTHPELLDWLASRFQESGYSLKSMHRLIMTSRAYRREKHLRG